MARHTPHDTDNGPDPAALHPLAAHPRVAVELVLADRVLNLVEDGIDVAIRIGRLPDSGDIARPVGATRRVLAASPDYLATAGTPTTPASLAGHRLISFSSSPP